MTHCSPLGCKNKKQEGLKQHCHKGCEGKNSGIGFALKYCCKETMQMMSHSTNTLCVNDKLKYTEQVKQVYIRSKKVIFI